MVLLICDHELPAAMAVAESNVHHKCSQPRAERYERGEHRHCWCIPLVRGPMEVGRSGQFRKLAREALAAAEAVDDTDCRRALVLMASSYEEMAKKLEE